MVFKKHVWILLHSVIIIIIAFAGYAQGLGTLWNTVLYLVSILPKVNFDPTVLRFCY